MKMLKWSLAILATATVAVMVQMVCLVGGCMMLHHAHSGKIYNNMPNEN